LILFAFSVALILYVLINLESVHVYVQILAYCLLMFSACMLCHGELYLLRPDAQHLTSFYLMVSIGGALGGIFTSLIAPFIFNGYWEFMVALAMTLALWLTVLRTGRAENHSAWARFMLTVFLIITVSLSLVGNLTGTLFSKRNFYGVICVRELIPMVPLEPAYAIHGITVTDCNSSNLNYADAPTTYYIHDGGAGVALAQSSAPGRDSKSACWVSALGHWRSTVSRVISIACMRSIRSSPIWRQGRAVTSHL
jgi:hypothetical protein